MRRHFRIRKILIVILVCLCFHICGSPFLVFPSHAEEPEALTLSLAIDTALKNNPLIRITLSGREIADAQLREVRAGWFPLLQFSETFTRSEQPCLCVRLPAGAVAFHPAEFSAFCPEQSEPAQQFPDSHHSQADAL